jgi:hypothetical protein
VEVQFQTFSTFALDGSEWLSSRLGRFSPGKEPLLTPKTGLGWHQNWSGRFGEEKKSTAPPGIRTPDRPARNPVTVSTANALQLRAVTSYNESQRDAIFLTFI